MADFEMLVIGGGTGNNVAKAADAGLETALVEPGKLGGEDVTAEQVVVATGSRPIVPPIDGFDDTDHLTSRRALYRDEVPDSLVVVGGGYIAVGLGYALESLDSDVILVEMMDSLIPPRDP